MRTVKLIVLGLVAVLLVLVGVANMSAVDLHLLPGALAGDRYSLTGVPLAVVILASILVGILVGQVLEWFRERRQRAMAEARRREIAALQREVATLRAKLGDDIGSLSRLPAA